MLFTVNSTISTGREGLSPTKFSPIQKAGIDIVDEELTPSGVSTMDGMDMCSYV
jgi:hypothetical protein